MTAFDNIRLEKGLYASGDFTGALEKIDPSENYSGTALEGLDAYQRQLKRFDIKVSGRHSDCVEKFFATTTSTPLFILDLSSGFRRRTITGNFCPSTVKRIRELFVNTVYERRAERITWISIISSTYPTFISKRNE